MYPDDQVWLDIFHSEPRGRTKLKSPCLHVLEKLLWSPAATTCCVCRTFDLAPPKGWVRPDQTIPLLLKPITIQSITSKWRPNHVSRMVDPDWMCGCGPERLPKPPFQISKGKNVGGASGPHPRSCGGRSPTLSIVQRPTSLSPVSLDLELAGSKSIQLFQQRNLKGKISSKCPKSS